MMSPEEAVRAYFDAYNGHPDRFGTVVAPDYVDYGHTPPGHGTQAAHDDYEGAIKRFGGEIGYVIDALVADGDEAAVAWTGTLPSGSTAHGLSLYRTADGLVRSARNALIGDLPAN